MVWGIGSSSTSGRPSDIVIVIMGPTGVGKSTFIQNYIGDAKVRVGVGEELESCTADVRPFEVKAPKKYEPWLAQRRLILVDTPGFDDTHTSDVEILDRVATWLARCYKDKTPVAGVIYMHKISDNRMRGSLHKNFLMFKKVCGADSFKKVVLATAHWQTLSESEHLKCHTRERELKEKYWNEVISGGGSVLRIEQVEGEAGRTIIHHMVEHVIERFFALESVGEELGALQIQKELVLLDKSLQATKAAQALRCTLEEARELEKKKKANKLDEKGRQELEEKLDSAKKQIRFLKPTMGERFKGFFGL